MIEGKRLTIGHLREGLDVSSGPVDDLILTRMLLARVGKAIWRYDTDLELLRGARDILKGISRCKRAKHGPNTSSAGMTQLNGVGWIHRDVSAGNCLLTRSPDEGPSFISDLEFAKKIDSQKSSTSAISVSNHSLLSLVLDYNDSSVGYRAVHGARDPSVCGCI
jgi:serine/threonine protein kinase